MPSGNTDANLVLDVGGLGVSGHAAALLGREYVRDEWLVAAVEAAQGAAQAQQDGHRRGAQRQSVVLREGPLLALALLHHAHEGLQQPDLRAANSMVIFITSKYRVSQQVSDMGWIDFDFDYATLYLILRGLMRDR